jgi:hypothetical protein
MLSTGFAVCFDRLGSGELRRFADVSVFVDRIGSVSFVFGLLERDRFGPPRADDKDAFFVAFLRAAIGIPERETSPNAGRARASRQTTHA